MKPMGIHFDAPFNIGDKVYIFDKDASFLDNMPRIVRTEILGYAYTKDYMDDKPMPKYIITDRTEEYGESYKDIALVFGSPDEAISAVERDPVLFGIDDKGEAKEIVELCKKSKVLNWT